MIMICSLPLTMLGYFQGVLVPFIPCWLSIVFTMFPYIPYAAVGMSQTLRLYYKYNCQHFMSIGQKDNWFVVNKGYLNGILIETLVFFSVSTFMLGIILTRMTPSTVDLNSSMDSYTCTSLTTVQVN